MHLMDKPMVFDVSDISLKQYHSNYGRSGYWPNIAINVFAKHAPILKSILYWMIYHSPVNRHSVMH